MSPIVRDDFLDAAAKDAIEAAFLNQTFPWHYYPNVNHAAPPPPGTPGQFPADDRFRDAPGLSNLIFPTTLSPHPGFEPARRVLESFLQALGIVPKKLIRIKANLLLRGEPMPKPFIPHVDLPIPHWVLIYYVNDSDGDTLILDKTYPDGSNSTILQSVSPRKGRALLFDGNHYHCGTAPATHDARCVLNFDFL